MKYGLQERIFSLEFGTISLTLPRYPLTPRVYCTQIWRAIVQAINATGLIYLSPCSKSHKLASHPGFEPCLCFGDALVWWEWEGAPGTRSASRPASREAPPKPKPTKTAHDFVRTHFHRSTQCDFCNKKVSYIAVLSGSLINVNSSYNHNYQSGYWNGV